MLRKLEKSGKKMLRKGTVQNSKKTLMGDTPEKIIERNEEDENYQEEVKEPPKQMEFTYEQIEDALQRYLEIQEEKRKAAQMSDNAVSNIKCFSTLLQVNEMGNEELLKQFESIKQSD